MEAAAPASAGSFREESAALGVGVGGALDGEGGAWAGKRGWSMTRHWRLNCFFALIMSVCRCFCLTLGGR